ncbi:MAG: hypothetical protein UT31_C0033G0002 [Parcubacteria group bacterium GW2011_GWF2_39_13b]|nr:MAG: hypothetical protein UT31_C0033G0002 [Parcubacteria group bacterium GW2011_GWF2_39_13b]
MGRLRWRNEKPPPFGGGFSYLFCYFYVSNAGIADESPRFKYCGLRRELSLATPNLERTTGIVNSLRQRYSVVLGGPNPKNLFNSCPYFLSFRPKPSLTWRSGEISICIFQNRSLDSVYPERSRRVISRPLSVIPAQAGIQKLK